MDYTRRIADVTYEAGAARWRVCEIRGMRGVGVTTFAARRARTLFDASHPLHRDALLTAPRVALDAPSPVAIDNWHDVDAIAPDLTEWAQTHNHRLIVTTSRCGPTLPDAQPLRLRPLSFAERDLCGPAVSLGALGRGRVGNLDEHCAISGRGYIDQILCSGLPGLAYASPTRRAGGLDDHLEWATSEALADGGSPPRKRQAARALLAAFARSCGHTTPLTELHRLCGRRMVSRDTATTWRDAWIRAMVLDPLPAWRPERGPARLTTSPRHFLADPALAARVCGIGPTLASTTSPGLTPVAGTWASALFLGLAALSVRVYAAAHSWPVAHVRTKRSSRDIPFIVDVGSGAIVPIAVTTSPVPSDRDVADLAWLAASPGVDVVDSVILTPGSRAWRREDGVLVLPLALLGP